MDLIQRNFPNVGVVEGQLPEDVVDNIWKVVNEAREQPEDMKPELAGNISKSIRLDGDSPLLKEFLGELIPSFIQSHIEAYGAPWRETMREGEGWNLESLWVNFQKQHEFNPPHDHSGVYSFVIWMQIPTSYAEQKKLPICANSNADNTYLTLHLATQIRWAGYQPLLTTWKKKQRVTWLCFHQPCSTKFSRSMRMTEKEYQSQAM